MTSPSPYPATSFAPCSEQRCEGEDRTRTRPPERRSHSTSLAPASALSGSMRACGDGATNASGTTGRSSLPKSNASPARAPSGGTGRSRMAGLNSSPAASIGRPSTTQQGRTRGAQGAQVGAHLCPIPRNWGRLRAHEGRTQGRTRGAAHASYPPRARARVHPGRHARLWFSRHQGILNSMRMPPPPPSISLPPPPRPTTRLASSPGGRSTRGRWAERPVSRSGGPESSSRERPSSWPTWSAGWPTTNDGKSANSFRTP